MFLIMLEFMGFANNSNTKPNYKPMSMELSVNAKLDQENLRLKDIVIPVM